MNLEKLTTKAQEALVKAQSLAQERHQPNIDPLHLLKALLEDKEGIISIALSQEGINLNQLEEAVDREINQLQDKKYTYGDSSTDDNFFEYQFNHNLHKGLICS